MIREGDKIKVVSSSSQKESEELVGQTGIVLSRNNNGKSFMVRFDKPKGRTDFSLSKSQIVKLEEA